MRDQERDEERRDRDRERDEERRDRDQEHDDQDWEEDEECLEAGLTGEGRNDWKE